MNWILYIYIVYFPLTRGTIPFPYKHKSIKFADHIKVIVTIIISSNNKYIKFHIKFTLILF